LLFWNVAGIVNKDKEFWRFIEGFDFVSLCETWVEEKDWESLKNKIQAHIFGSATLQKGIKRKEGRKGIL